MKGIKIRKEGRVSRKEGRKGIKKGRKGVKGGREDTNEGWVSRKEWCQGRKEGCQGRKGVRKEGHQERVTVMAVEVVVVAVNEGRASRKGHGDGGG